MKYLGNKNRLLPFIMESIVDFGIKIDENITIVDLFSGTGSVSSMFLKQKCKVISCDNMFYSVCEQYRVNFFNKAPKFKELQEKFNLSTLDKVLNHLNDLTPTKGYYYENFAPSGKYNRQYFSDFNAQKIDSIRKEIESWKKHLPYSKYAFLLGVLMDAADAISNTAGTYGAYLKIWRPMALKKIRLNKPDFLSKGTNEIHFSNVEDLIKELKHVDLVYIDPPYNTRQYASNFHVLESIVVFDKQDLRGKTGLRNYDHQKSSFSLKTKAKKAMENLLNNIDAKYIVLSYSTEGIIEQEELKKMLDRLGKVKIYRKRYRRFKTNSLTEANTSLKELLFICELD